MRFDYVIGNPPYQDDHDSIEIEGSLKNYAPPIYDKFMDAAYTIGDKVELIHPARFLFNAGSTPKAWNKKMLNDEHFKILSYEPVSQSFFPNTDIKGGIVVSYRDQNQLYDPIIIFSSYNEMNSILNKVRKADGESLINIVYPRTSFRLTKKLHIDYPNAKDLLSDGHLYDVASNIFQRLPFVFVDKPGNDGVYVKILGRDQNRRVIKYIRRDYINIGRNLDEYKLFIPQASGTGAFGETIGSMEIGEPGMAATETFLSIGSFDDLQSVLNVEKYVKTKFFRSLRSLLKVTQIANRSVYEFIPLQDFTSNSDINWSLSIPEIDQQLYRKYGLSPEETAFIESHVKEMK